MEKKFTLSQVAGHATDDDCWIVYKDIVYDITDFVEDKSQHPFDFSEYYGKDVTVHDS